VTEPRGFGAEGPVLADVGETGLLSRLLGGRRTTAPGVLLGPGDDAALWQPPSGAALALTQDALVENVDFVREWTTPYYVGRRALALSLSDLAAMGAQPAWCLATFCAPGSTPVADVEALHDGLQSMAAEFECPVVGGDVSAIDGPLVLDVVAGGTVEPSRALRRDAGVPGDLLVVTGVLGRAAAGLRVLRGLPPRGVDPDAAARWRIAQLDPSPRVAEGLHLAALGVRCAGDVSDGLLVDARRTAEASGCAAELWRDALPIDPELRTCFGEDWLQLAIGGGEDFELLAAAPPSLLDEWPPDLTPLHVVGRLTSGSGVTLRSDDGGDALPLPQITSRHFGS
jgi:thiamine-monophosphate kinase